MTSELATREAETLATSCGYDMIPVEQIKRQTDQVKALMASCMSDGMHYGKIPGCGDKPTLLQPGAQKLTMMFGLADTYEISREDLPNGHREYTVKCLLVSKSTGLVQGSGVGLCSTMEKKYRYRNVSDFEITDQPIPQDARERKQEYRKQGYGMKKVDGQWCWVKYMDSTQQENPDIADTYNTVLKMACKRALVAAVLNTLAVSDLFTQDVEDLGSYAIDFNRPPQPPHQPAEPQPHEDPRKFLWAEVADLKAQALALGTNEGGITSWLAVNITNPDGSPKQMKLYTAEEIIKLRDFLAMNIANHEQLAAQEPEYVEETDYVAPDLADHDIAF